MAKQVEQASEMDESTTGRHFLRYTGIGPPRRRADTESQFQPGEITSLGSLEAEVLGILWQIGRPATGMEVMETILYKRRSQGEDPGSFATIATTLRRLDSKGLVLSKKNSSRTPVYWPTVEREQMAARILNNVTVILLGQTLSGLIPKLMGDLDQPPTNPEDTSELESLRRLKRSLDEISHRESERDADPAK